MGGGNHLLDFGATRVLVDAGIKPDGRDPLAPNFGKLDGLDAAVITHAHLDHCGALPLLVRDEARVADLLHPPSAKLIVSALQRPRGDGRRTGWRGADPRGQEGARPVRQAHNGR